MTKRLIIFGAAVMSALLGLATVWQFRIVVVYVVISLALAATVRPFVKDWTERGRAARLILILLYVIGVCGFGFLIFLVGRLAIGDVHQLAQILSVQAAWKLPAWLQGSLFQQALVAWLPMPSDLLKAFTGDQGQLVLPVVLGFTQSVGGSGNDIKVSPNWRRETLPSRWMRLGGVHCMMSCRTNRYKKKEISNAIHYYRNSAHTLVARIFRTECILWLSALRQCRSYFDRHRNHSHYFKTAENRVMKKGDLNVS